jgi:hypothetical protein
MPVNEDIKTRDADELAIIGNGFYSEENEPDLYGRPDVEKWILTKKAMRIEKDSNFELVNTKKIK